MAVPEFFAGHVGRVTVGDREHDLTVVDLGLLHVASGVLGAADPFVNLDEPLTTSVPPGSWPVQVTLADVSPALDGSHVREAYLSLVLADGEVDRVETIVPDGLTAPGPDEYYGVPVDAGTVAFVDAAAVATGMPDGDWYDEVFDPDRGLGWFGMMDDPTHLRAGSANITLPRATGAENVVLTHSGWGDGIYPLLRSHAADGTLLGVHLDLLVLVADDDGPDAHAVDGSHPHADPDDEGTPWWRRVLRR